MLRNRETIAGAVAREIDRIHQTGDAIAEGAAYKAAWDRAGSDWSKHCAAFAADCERATHAVNVREAIGFPIPLFQRPHWTVTPSVYGVSEYQGRTV